MFLVQLFVFFCSFEQGIEFRGSGATCYRSLGKSITYQKQIHNIYIYIYIYTYTDSGHTGISLIRARLHAAIWHADAMGADLSVDEPAGTFLLEQRNAVVVACSFVIEVDVEEK